MSIFNLSVWDDIVSLFDTFSIFFGRYTGYIIVFILLTMTLIFVKFILKIVRGN